MNSDHEGAIRGAVAQLLQSVHTLQLATVNDAGLPLSSYTPYLHIPGRGFYIYVSELAGHTRNLQRHCETGVLIIADESATKQLFARERLSIECVAEFIARDSDDWALCMDALEESFGSVLKLIRGLKDFHLVFLKPLGGVYVRGFGEAWSFEGADLEHFGHIDSELLAQTSSTGTSSA